MSTLAARCMTTSLVRRLTPALLLVATGLAAGCNGTGSSSAAVSSSGGAGMLENSPIVVAASVNREGVKVDPNGGTIAALLERLGPDVREFMQHDVTLANLFFEGRVPGSNGGAVAADYLEFYMRRAGLEPAFGDSFRQTFTVPGELEVTEQAASYAVNRRERGLVAGDDFNVLGFTGSAEATGQIAFVGYAIEEGPDGYSSFADTDDLTGKIALMFRFEPMDSRGKSKWSENARWSRHAGLAEKVRAVAKRGAAGVILVNPPAADDPRAERLATPGSTAFRGLNLEVPAIAMSHEAADAMLQSATGRSLLEYRRMADERGGVMDIPSASVSLAAGVRRPDLPTDNVAGVIPGKGALADEFLVIGAHYDHIGYGYFGSRAPELRGHIHPGADDNASGTAGLLMLARKLKERYDRLPEGEDARSILFIGFTAEESGLVGSRHFVDNMPFSKSQVQAMLNMDMIGRLKDGELTVYGTGTAPGFDALLKPHFDRSGMGVKSEPGGQGPSDHSSFYSADIPVLAFFTGLHTDYHRPEDEAWKINHEGGARIAALVGAVAMDLAMRPERLEFTSTGTTTRVGSISNVSVRLGIAPGNYADTQGGVLVGGVTEGTSAADAGIRPGDRIIRWGGEELADIGAMMQRLADHKPGDKVEMVIVRDGKEIPITVTMKARESGG